MAETVRQARAQADERIAESQAEERRVRRELQGHHRDLQRLLGHQGTSGTGEVTATLLADLQERVQASERRLSELRDERERLQRELIDEDEAARALADFDPVWATLSPREQTRLLQLVIERVNYDGRDGSFSITFHPGGLKALADRDVTGDAA